MTKRKGFFMVSNNIFELGLKPRTLAVYCCLLRHRDNSTHHCWPSRKTIAELCSCTERTVDKAIQELCGIGLVKKEGRYTADGRRTSSLYTVCSLLPEGNSAQETGSG